MPLVWWLHLHQPCQQTRDIFVFIIGLQHFKCKAQTLVWSYELGDILTQDQFVLRAPAISAKNSFFSLSVLHTLSFCLPLSLGMSWLFVCLSSIGSSCNWREHSSAGLSHSCLWSQFVINWELLQLVLKWREYCCQEYCIPFLGECLDTLSFCYCCQSPKLPAAAVLLVQASCSDIAWTVLSSTQRAVSCTQRAVFHALKGTLCGEE